MLDTWTAPALASRHASGCDGWVYFERPGSSAPPPAAASAIAPRDLLHAAIFTLGLYFVVIGLPVLLVDLVWKMHFNLPPHPPPAALRPALSASLGLVLVLASRSLSALPFRGAAMQSDE